MSASLPEVTRLYQNHILDSTRWHEVPGRAGDIVVATPYKSGTTWMQHIVLHLIFQDLAPRSVGDHSPWVERRGTPLAELNAKLAAQPHRRCLKTHLPLDGLPWRAEAQYIVVGRDPRDVAMSMWNHYSALTPGFFERTNGVPDRVGPPLPPCPDEIGTFWRDWITRGWFDWETEGYPFWSNLRHVRTWWAFRHLPNILFVHFNDLLADLEGQVGRIAGWLGIDCAAEMRARIAEATTFETLKRTVVARDTRSAEVFEGGAARFYHKGTNGRWRDVLGPDDLALYATAAARELPPDCRRWLERGGPAGI